MTKPCILFIFVLFLPSIMHGAEKDLDVTFVV